MTSVGRRRLELFQDALEARLGEQIQRRAPDAEPLAARLHLVLGFLARAVEHRPDVARDVGRRLQQQRGLADARLAAEQHHRARHDAAAEHAIQFADAGRQSRRRAHLDVGVQPGAGAARHERAVAVAAGRCGRRIADALFDQRIPRPAVSAAAQPLGGLAAAFLAHEDVSGLHPWIMPQGCWMTDVNHRDTEARRTRTEAYFGHRRRASVRISVRSLCLRVPVVDGRHPAIRPGGVW